MESQQVVEGGGIYKCECGWHHYIDSRKGDSHSVHNSDPTRTRTYICVPLPQPVVTPPTPSDHSPSHWLHHFPTTTPSGINTPHVPSQSFFTHLPMKMEPIEGSETSAIRTKTPGNYPKDNILQMRIYSGLLRRTNNIQNGTTFYTPLHKQISASKQNNNELLNVRQLLKENKKKVFFSNKRTKKGVNFKRRGQL